MFELVLGLVWAVLFVGAVIGIVRPPKTKPVIGIPLNPPRKRKP